MEHPKKPLTLSYQVQLLIAEENDSIFLHKTMSRNLAFVHNALEALQYLFKYLCSILYSKEI